MHRMFLSVLGVFAVVGFASAQQPQPPQPQSPQPVYQQPPIALPSYSPAAMAAVPAYPGGGAAVISTSGGCRNCAGLPTDPSLTGGQPTHGFQMLSGGHCMLGYGCQNGAGSFKSDLAFQFGTTKQFFSPCGPSCEGGLFGGKLCEKCGKLPFAKPYGIGWQCPRQYDTYANH